MSSFLDLHDIIGKSFPGNHGVLCYTKHMEPTKPYNALHICIPEARLKEAFQICKEGITSGHRGVNDTLDKFQKTFFVLSTEGW